MIVGILMTVSKQYQICFEMPLLPVFTGKSGGVFIIPTRRINPKLKHFCLGFVIPREKI